MQSRGTSADPKLDHRRDEEAIEQRARVRITGMQHHDPAGPLDDTEGSQRAGVCPWRASVGGAVVPGPTERFAPGPGDESIDVPGREEVALEESVPLR